MTGEGTEEEALEEGSTYGGWQVGYLTLECNELFFLTALAWMDGI